MRKTIEEIETNLAYRCFLGFGFHDKIPHFSTFGKKLWASFQGHRFIWTDFLWNSESGNEQKAHQTRTCIYWFYQQAYRTTTKDGYRQYVSNPLRCKDCPFLSRCTQRKNHQKVIQRHVWEEHMEEADHLCHTEEHKIIDARSKEIIEWVYADAKEKHDMRWTTLRGIEKLFIQAVLCFCYHETEEDGQLAVENAKNGLN